MTIDPRKYEFGRSPFLRDIRPLYIQFFDWASNPAPSAAVFLCLAASMHIFDVALYFSDFIFIVALLYLQYLRKGVDRALPLKMPMGADIKDPNNDGPGRNNKPEGILYLGNHKNTNEEIWFTNSDARTHILYLGTTGSGKTEGLKSISSNALTWGSGFIYIDGKADTDLWSSISSLVRRFGRDDDLLVLNYMTANSDIKAPSNTMNPFANGSASFLTNLLTSLMPQAEGDNVMWKERAVALVATLMPALTYKRDYNNIPLTVSAVRKYLLLNKIIELSRDQTIPEYIREGVRGYLDTLPGYVDEAFDDYGKPKPPGPDQPMANTEVPFQQHGYLSMQLTRALQSLGDEYGYIFDDQYADVDMIDVVLNRRILVVLIPALEKSDDEIANLGKIVSATIKGMMGSTLGAEVEGDQAKVIDNKPTHSSTPFITIFDEVGYYTAEGMAVMAAQARSLGFCLVFAAQDLNAMQKKVKEEAKSITSNCNIKLFGKIEDPGETRQFFKDSVGEGYYMWTGGYKREGGFSYGDTQEAKVEEKARSSFDDLKDHKEGEATIIFQANKVYDLKVFYSNPGHAKAMRVTRYLDIGRIDPAISKYSDQFRGLRDKLVKKGWTAESNHMPAETTGEMKAMLKGLKKSREKQAGVVEQGIAALGSVYALTNTIEKPKEETQAPPAQAASPEQPASQQPQKQNQQQPPQQTEQAGSPMGIFKKEEQSKPEATTQVPVQYQEVAKEEEELQKPSALLDAEIKNTIASAANDVRKSIFRDSLSEKRDKDEDVIGAAE